MNLFFFLFSAIIFLQKEKQQFVWALQFHQIDGNREILHVHIEYKSATTFVIFFFSLLVSGGSVSVGNRCFYFHLFLQWKKKMKGRRTSFESIISLYWCISCSCDGEFGIFLKNNNHFSVEQQKLSNIFVWQYGSMMVFTRWWWWWWNIYHIHLVWFILNLYRWTIICYKNKK